MAVRRFPTGGLDWSRARVGAVLILGLMLLAYGVYQVGALFDVFADRYTLFTAVSTTTGLREGAPVTLAGHRVGQVDAIEFIPIERQTGDENLLIRISVDEAIREHIRRDSRTRILTQGLVGDKYLNIEPGSPEWPMLQPGDTVVSEPAVDIDHILVQADDALRQTQDVLTDLQRVTTSLRRGEGTLGQLLTEDTLYRRALAATREASVVLGRINRGEGTLGRLVRDPAVYVRMQGALSRVDSIASIILRGEGTLGRLVRSDTVHQGMLGLLGQASGTFARADTAIGGLSALTGQLTGGGGTLQRLLTDPQLYDEFLKAVVDLQTVILDIRERPQRYRPEVNIDIF